MNPNIYQILKRMGVKRDFLNLGSEKGRRHSRLEANVGRNKKATMKRHRLNHIAKLSRRKNR